MTRKIYLDTNAFIAAFEHVDTLQAIIWPVLNAIETGEFYAVTSEMTLA